MDALVHTQGNQSNGSIEETTPSSLRPVHTKDMQTLTTQNLTDKDEQSLQQSKLLSQTEAKVGVSAGEIEEKGATDENVHFVVVEDSLPTSPAEMRELMIVEVDPMEVEERASQANQDANKESNKKPEEEADSSDSELGGEDVEIVVEGEENSDNEAHSKEEDGEGEVDAASLALRTKQSARVKQFFTTLQKFGNNMSRDGADQVQELISALLNGLVTVEEFHQEIQSVTNHPLKEFVIPFLKENLKYFQQEMKNSHKTLATILGSAPPLDTPNLTPEHAEPELLVVPSTKPTVTSTATTTTTTTTPTLGTPSSPFRAPANLVSMSAPPATIHEPLNASPTVIETVPNNIVPPPRKRPRDLSSRNLPATSTQTISPMAAKRSRTLNSSSSEAVVIDIDRSSPGLSSPSHHHTHHPGTPMDVVVTPDSSTLLLHSSSTSTSTHKLLQLIREDWIQLETMLASIEGMVSKTQKAFSVLKERVQQAGVAPSLIQLKAMEVEREQQIQLRITQAVDEAKHQASEEKQRLLMDASRQMREAIKDCNTQSSSKESCWNCGRHATETCSGCNKARYCGIFCQHKDWDRHMKQCAGIKSATRVASNILPTAHPSAGTPVVLASPNPPSSTAEVVIMQGVDTGTEHVPMPFIVRGVPDHSWSGDGVLQTSLGNTLVERIN